MKFKVRSFDIDFGQEEVVLNIKDAREWGLRALDRIKIFSDKGQITAIVNTTKSFVKKGKIGVFHKICDQLKI